MMWGLARWRPPATRLAVITDYDRPLITALVAARSPALTFGREDIGSHLGLGSITRVIVGASSDDLEWLEAATDRLGGRVLYMSIRRSNRRSADLEAKLASADSVAAVGHAISQVAEGDAILAGARGTGRPDTDRELRRIVEEGRAVRRRGFDRDLQLADQYATHHYVDEAAVLSRATDRQRYEELIDEYQLMNGRAPATWPF